ncbi:hypothetical protein GYMLUDRAFT_37844 [Collybiopsis luxurians FD-317 M1]|nr:hypothetical protein GYMLUDRAFT_37844 [Collybiopsis luxurians FD-317 M1]
MAAPATPPFTYTIDNPETSAFPDIRDVPPHKFQTMLKTHPFLYRVHDDRSYVIDDLQYGFIARQYVEKSGVEIQNDIFQKVLPLNFNNLPLRSSIPVHIRNFHRRSAPRLGRIFPWISSSPSWTWALGEAIERNRMRINDKDRAQIIMVSVIDLRKLLEYEKSLRGRIVYYGMELLHLTNQMDDEIASHWTNSPQEIMVYGMIPRSAIKNTIIFAEPFTTITVFPGLNLPLPLWFYQNHTASENTRRLVWPQCRYDYWYCGDHRGEGMRTSLLRNFKNWAESRIQYRLRLGKTMAEARDALLDDIASASFCLAAFLIFPEGTFEDVLKIARTQVQESNLIAENEAELQFLTSTITEGIFKKMTTLCELAEIIAKWGFDQVDDTTSRDLHDRIHRQADREILRQLFSIPGIRI